MFGHNRKTEEALQQRREAMGRLKLAAKNEKLMILVGWTGAALGIIAAGTIWGVGRSAATSWSMDVHSGHPSGA
jgi:hypothetical protein